MGDNVSSNCDVFSVKSNEHHFAFIDAQTNLRKHFAIFIVTALQEVAKLIDRIVGLDF